MIFDGYSNVSRYFHLFIYINIFVNQPKSTINVMLTVNLKRKILSLKFGFFRILEAWFFGIIEKEKLQIYKTLFKLEMKIVSWKFFYSEFHNFSLKEYTYSNT